MKNPKGNGFLFLGPELGEKQDAIKEIRAALKDAPFEETHFYAGETPLYEIVSVLQNGSLFAEDRFLIIKNADVLKKKEETDLLASAIKNLDSNTILILVSDETRIDKRIEDAVSKENKRIFWEMFENNKIGWVTAFFRRESCPIDEGGIKAILEMVENNTDALNRECSHLVLFLGKDKMISAEDVERCLSHTREESAFTLFAAIARGNALLSLEIFRSLAASGSSAQALNATLAWCFRKLNSYLALSGNSNDFELKKIGITTSRARSDYAEAAKRWPQGANAALALIGEHEYLLRSSGTAWEEILMDDLILRLACGYSSVRLF
jgi:DNA polymerase-3 subunit delta